MPPLPGMMLDRIVLTARRAWFESDADLEISELHADAVRQAGG
ncbi:hypothetical protein APASM_3853 [Actinosynnema pretiosum subsp. pretiosum]|nr:hypothetical protein APASM_3853 [Actinosynnema pretiosum subsp. pretiosum]